MGPVTNTKKNKDESEILKQLRIKRKKLKQEKLLERLKKTKIDSENNESAPDKTNKTEEEITPASKKLHTLSIAVPGSILDNAQSQELRTYLAGQIARAACVFEIDEVIVYDDLGDTGSEEKVQVDEEVYGIKTARRCCAQLARILQYQECPQYLRKYFFPFHHDLNYVGLLNPLDAPHHLRQTDEFAFREGIVTNLPSKPGQSSVNVGLYKDITVDKALTPGIRVTVKMQPNNKGTKKIRGTVVAPTAPRTETGIYWGYNVRLALTLGNVFCQSPYPGGYDLTIGTSDKGRNVDELPAQSLSDCSHALVVFGGLSGLEAALENDEKLMVDDPSFLFDHYLNTCPNQGSRTIRTEEAILISMAALRSKLGTVSEQGNFTKIKHGNEKST
uniref:Uncharacterized protein n=1 Tax=Timema poppense TaxID=170557 RepID=A0A7R9GVK9_TIMPO|nr:unnamed protein product [Timema poppensis]